MSGEYRVGNHQQPQNLYRGNDYIGVMFDPADTAMIVKAMNSEQILAQPARTQIYRVDYSEPRCLFRQEAFLGIFFAEEDAALVVRVLNVAGQQD